MKKIVKLSVATAMLMGMGAVSAQAADGGLLTNIKVKGEIRARYEMVDGDSYTGFTPKDTTTNPVTPAKNGHTVKHGNANAMTNRLVLGVGADIAGTDWLSAYAEMTDVHSINNDNYKSTNNDNPNNKNVVADPEQTRLTQSYIDVKGGGALLRAGRQMVNLDNQRFVGAVGWRQMPQTFDAYLLAYSGVENLSLAAAYVTKVNRIFADDKDSLDTRSVILHAGYKVADALSITAYDYMLSAGTGGGNTGRGVGSDTIGIAFTGKPKLGDIVLNYRAEYAMMTDPSMENAGYKGKNDDVDAEYLNLELGMNMSGILAGIGYEVQSGMTDSEAAANKLNKGDYKTFSTALGTNHKFNGWADQFLATPRQGLEDLNAHLGYKSKDFGVFKVVYHKFTSAEESIDYGSEVDAVYKRAIPGVKGLTGMLKFASYIGDDNEKDSTSATGYDGSKSEDVQKFWVMLDYKFTSN